MTYFVLISRSPALTSLIWSYFVRTQSYALAHCKLCSENIERPGGKNSEARSHLETDHNKQFQEMKQKEEKQNGRRG